MVNSKKHTFYKLIKQYFNYFYFKIYYIIIMWSPVWGVIKLSVKL